MRLNAILLTAVTLATTTSVALAQAPSNVCVRLEARLAMLDRGPDAASAANYRRYDEALRKQQQEYERTRQQAQRAGCGGGFLFFRAQPAPQCGQLNQLLDRMQRNMADLEARRNRYAGQQRDTGWERQEVLTALGQNRCGPAYERYARGGGLTAIFFGRQQRTDDPWNRAFSDAPRGAGTYRTLCVRSCDGYYFPISFSTVPSKFAEDEQTCRSMCPGTEASLYIHRNPGEDSEQMVSLQGAPYSALPAAFAYRQSYNSACTCRSPGALANVTVTRTGGQAAAPDGGAPSLPPAPIPRLKPVAGEDPETLANAFGAFTPRAPTRRDGDAVAGLVESAGKRVRLVGPSYYYAQ